MEAQGAVKFLELKGQVYPALVREFYVSFRHNDGSYWSMISGNLFELDEDLFMNVGGLSASGYGIGYCSWLKENFDAPVVYKSFLRGWHLYVQGELTKAGSLSVENRLLHYLIAYILVQRNTNLAQPTVNDLHFMYAVKNIVMINWPEEILKEDHTTVDLDISSDEDQTGIEGQNATAQGEPSGTTAQEPGFGLAHLDDIEQRINNRMDLHFQELKDFYHADLEHCEERLTAYHDNQYQNMRTLVQSSVEAQNALIQSTTQSLNDFFYVEFQKLTLLVRGDQNMVVPDDDVYPPPPQP
ncbi:unnamed protein product [Lupinus luteus]|uniref:Uncharacterized protein n=1 Tax=Lupinus luteus TaxID=3873 RepID=A0AAV1WFS0_LUPLU